MTVLDPNVLPDLMRTEANHQAFQAEINQLARIILESCGPSAGRERASREAEAQIELNRVRRARQLITCDHQKAQVVADEHRALTENHD